MAIIQGIRGAGNGLAANQKRDIWKTLMVLKPYNTPLSQFIIFGRKPSKPVFNKTGTFSWMEDTLLPHDTTTTAAITAVSGQLTLNATNCADFSIFNVDDLVLITETSKMGIVVSTTSTTAVLENPDGTALTDLTSGHYITILTSMNSENALQRTAYTTQEVEKTNRLTIMSDTVSVTNREEAGQSYTNGLSLAEQIQKKMEEMKFQFERLALLSLTSGLATTTDSMVKSWGQGALGTFTTHASTYTTTTEAGLDTWLEAVGKQGSTSRLLLAGSTVYFDIQKIIKAKYGTLPTNQIVKKYGVDLTTYKHGYLNVNLVEV